MLNATQREDVRVLALQSVEVVVDIARRGFKQPSTLTTKEIEAICRTLLFQLAQMGIR